jgi:hypothetical protein
MSKTFFISTLVVLILMLQSTIVSQSINLNPDPNGEPWIAGGIPELTEEAREQIRNMPRLDLSDRKILLPARVDNKKFKYFPPIFNQVGSSCAQASGVGIQFTYETNFVRDTDASLDQNRFPSHFTWNFLNDGEDNGSWSFTGFDILKDHGCINVADYGGIGDDCTYWCTGYDKYYRGMHSRLEEYFIIKVDTPEGLNTLKQWIFDHGNGSAAGGLANFACEFGGITMPIIDGKPVVTSWGVGSAHAMTFIGYDDSIGFDVNGDGKITNDIDINNDRAIDVKDMEKGVLKIANTWGANWQDSGCIYMQYRLCALPVDEGGIHDNHVYIMTTKIHTPKLTIKVNISHPVRSYIAFAAGLCTNMKDTLPEFKSIVSYHGFSFAGGKLPMQGNNRPPELELGLDLSYSLDSITGDPMKAFLRVDCRKEEAAAKIISVSAIDYRGASPLELAYPHTNFPIVYPSQYIPIILDPNYKPLQIVTNKLPNARVNQPYSHTMEATGGYAPYSWKLKPEPYTQGSASGSFPDITTNELTPSAVFEGIVEKNLGFEFPFYGERFSKVYITTDGTILFAPQYVRVRSEQDLVENKAIAVLGGSYYFNTFDDYIYYSGDQTKATFRWKTIHMVNMNEVNFDFAVTLHASGEIECYYGKDLTDNITTMVIGASDGGGNNFVSDIQNTSNIPDNHSFKLVPGRFPKGMALSSTGIFSGTPTEDKQSWDVNFVVTDKYEFEEIKKLQFSTKEVPIALNDTKPQTNAFSVAMVQGHITVSFTTKEPGPVKLEIYSMNGRKVMTLIDDNVSAGTYRYVLDRETLNHNPIAQGIYFIHLNHNNVYKVKKAVLFQ